MQQLAIHEGMDALLLAATVVETKRDRAAARARVAQLPFVAAPLGAHPGPVVSVTAAAVPPSLPPPRSGTRTPLQSPSPCPPPLTLAAKAVQKAQLAILREAYDEPHPHYQKSSGRFPNKKRVEELAARTGRTERQVRIFFQNERQRRKNKAKRGGERYP